MSRKTILFLHVICPLAAGALIYCLAAPDVIFIKKTEDFMGWAFPMQKLPTGGTFLRLIRNYLPDMMWGYSLVFALFYIIGNNAASIRKVFGMAFSFSAVMEMMQKVSFVPGTFDVFDIAVEFLAEAIAACIIYKYKLYSREEF